MVEDIQKLIDISTSKILAQQLLSMPTQASSLAHTFQSSVDPIESQSVVPVRAPSETS